MCFTVVTTANQSVTKTAMTPVIVDANERYFSAVISDVGIASELSTRLETFVNMDSGLGALEIWVAVRDISMNVQLIIMIKEVMVRVLTSARSSLLKIFFILAHMWVSFLAMSCRS